MAVVGAANRRLSDPTNRHQFSEPPDHVISSQETPLWPTAAYDFALGRRAGNRHGRSGIEYTYVGMMA